MYGDFAQAMVANMTQRMDPMNKIIGSLMDGQAKSQNLELILQQDSTISTIAASLEKARNATPVNVSVIDAYERLLNKATQ